METKLPPLSHPEMIDPGRTYVVKRPRDLGGGTMSVLGEELPGLVLEVNRAYRLIEPPAMVPTVDLWDRPGALEWLDINRAVELMRASERFVVDAAGGILPMGPIDARFGPVTDRAWLIFHWNRVAEAEEAARTSESSEVERAPESASEEILETTKRPRRPSPWTKEEGDKHE